MKKSIFSFLLILFTVLCAHAKTTNVGLLSVFIDKNMTEGINDDFISIITGDDYFEFDSLANNFKERFFEDYAPELPVNILPEETVIKAEGYKNLGTGNIKSQRFATPEGYVHIDSRWGSKDKKAIAKAFNILPDTTDLIMITYLNFRLVESGTIDNVTFSKIQVYANLKIMDKNGKQIVSIKERAKSIDRVVALELGGGWSISAVHDLKPLCFQALHKLYQDLDDDLKKDSKKISKKITKWRIKTGQ